MKKYLFIALFFIILSVSIVLASVSGYIYSSPAPEKTTQEPTTVQIQKNTESSSSAESSSTKKDVEVREPLTVEKNNAYVIPLSQDDEEKLTAWTSSNNEILTIDSGGRIDALATGTATVTAEFSDKTSAEYKVTVSETFNSEPYDGYSTSILANTDILEKNIQNGYTNPYYIKVNRTQNCVTVYTYDDYGKYTVPVRAMICSSGKNNATVLGDYNLYFKNEWNGLFQGVFGHYVSGITGNYLFHSVPYYSKNPDRLEVEEFNKLGEQASLGCIRMATADVKWIFDNCSVNTGITIYDDDNPGPLGKPEGIKITDFSCGWDPTDSDPDNPYNDKKPEIKGTADLKIKKGTEFSALRGVSATDTCGNDITSQINVIGNVVTARPGTYKVSYEVEDVMHRTDSVTISITVVEK